MRQSHFSPFSHTKSSILHNPATFFFGRQGLVRRLMAKVQVDESAAATPIGKATRQETTHNTARSTIFIHVEGPILGRGTITDIDACIHGHKVVKGHPKGAVIGVDKAHRLFDTRMLFPHFALVGPIALPFERPPWIACARTKEKIRQG